MREVDFCESKKTEGEKKIRLEISLPQFLNSFHFVFVPASFSGDENPFVLWTFPLAGESPRQREPSRKGYARKNKSHPIFGWIIFSEVFAV